MQYEILTSLRSKLAEGPLYHPEENAVYWTDIEGGRLHRHRLETGQTETIHSGTRIGGFTLQEDGDILLFRDGGAIHRFRGSEILEELVESIPEERETRFNDVSADPAGRVFCGTMPVGDRKGRFYRLDHDGTLSIVFEEIGLPNGMGWSPDEQTMYLTDTVAGTIYAFDYDRDSGELSRRRDFYVRTENGSPDGMTVDGEGNVWTAIWGGGVVVQIDPQGNVIREVELPARKITSPAFGGNDLSDLYITAAGGDTPEDGPGAGELIRIKPGVKGKPEFKSRIQTATIGERS